MCGSSCDCGTYTVLEWPSLVFAIQDLVCLLSGNWHFFNESRNYRTSWSCLHHCCHEGSGSLIWRTNSWNCAVCMDTVTWRCAVLTDHPTLTQYILQTLHNWLHSSGMTMYTQLTRAFPPLMEVDWLVRLAINFGYRTHLVRYLVASMCAAIVSGLWWQYARFLIMTNPQKNSRGSTQD